jgi:hypothetical protein
MNTFLNRCDMVLKGKAISQDIVLSLESYLNEDFITSKVPLVNFTKDLSGVGYEEAETLILDQIDKIKSNTKVMTVDDLNNRFDKIRYDILYLKRKLKNNDMSKLTELFTNEKYKYIHCSTTNKFIELQDIPLITLVSDYQYIMEVGFDKDTIDNIRETLIRSKEEGDGLFKPLQFLRYLAKLSDNDKPFYNEIIEGEIPYIELSEVLKFKDLYFILSNKEVVIKRLTELKEICLKFIWGSSYIDDKELLGKAINSFDNIISLISYNITPDEKSLFDCII